MCDVCCVCVPRACCFSLWAHPWQASDAVWANPSLTEHRIHQSNSLLLPPVQLSHLPNTYWDLPSVNLWSDRNDIHGPSPASCLWLAVCHKNCMEGHRALGATLCWGSQGRLQRCGTSAGP